MIVVHGKISKVEKGRYTQFFLNPEHPNDVNINVLCTTSGVVNVGLDSPHIRNIFWMEFPPPPLDFVQEIGRSGRFHPPYPINHSYILYLCIKKFIYIFDHFMNPGKTYNDEQFFQEEVDNLFDMKIMVVLSQKCYYIAPELLFGKSICW